MEKSPSPTQTFGDHLNELRKRLIFSFFSILFFSVLGYFLNEKIIEFLVRPLNKSLYYTSPTGGFDIVFKVSFLFGLLMSTPFLAYQFIKFIEPVLSKKSEKFIIFFSIFSFVLMILGVSFAYFLSLPAALSFLNKFGSTNIKALISTKDYFSFVLVYILGFGVLFQLPLVLVAINWVKPLKPRKLLGYISYVVLISFIIAAIITPTPDPFNQTIMALPIIFLYVFSVFLVWFINKFLTHKSN